MEKATGTTKGNKVESSNQNDTKITGSITGPLCAPADLAYFKLLDRILFDGELVENRTGVGTKRIISHDFTLSALTSLNVLTCKRVYYVTALKELYAFLNRFYLKSQFESLGIKYWSVYGEEFGVKDDNLGPIYGVQWRQFSSTESYEAGVYVDQVAKCVDSILNNPNSRRHIISAWNPLELDKMALPPCTVLYQFFPIGEHDLSLKVYQRSCDVMVGLPFNMVQASALLHIMAMATGRIAKDVHFSLGDCHIYKPHMGQAWELHKRFENADVKNGGLGYAEPALVITSGRDKEKDYAPLIWDRAYTYNDLKRAASIQLKRINGNLSPFRFDEWLWSDFKLLDYKHGPEIPLEMVV